MSLDAAKMSEVEQNLIERKERLKSVTSKPFNIKDDAHRAFLKSYVSDFEYNSNLMYLYHAFSFSQGSKIWGLGTLAWTGLRYTIGLPGFVNYLLSSVFWTNVVGYLLEKFNLTDFSIQLNEMKEIYNWTMKNGKTDYNSSIDNNEKMANPDIQKMISLLAPFCTVTFMQAWPKVTKGVEQQSSWASVFTYGASIVSTTFSKVAGEEKPSVDHNRIQELKVSVETNGLQVGLIKGVEQALKYFFGPNFRERLITKLQTPLEELKATTSSSVTGMVLKSN